METKRIIKLSKAILILILAIYFTFVVVGNLTDYGSNFMFVEHVLKMDTTFNSPNLMYRAIDFPTFHHIFYWVIILTEIFAGLFLWRGALKLCSKEKSRFERGKNLALIGLIISMIIWLGFFITVGGEWFAMWQSDTWNGLSSAFRIFTISAAAFIILMHKDN